MNLDEWFQKGMTAQEYVDSMENHQENLIYIYENFTVPTEDYPMFERLQKRNLRAIVLTEDWCGDAMLNIPIYLHLAEAGHIQTHFLLRDENPDLMDQYLTNGTSRSIPKFIFINPDGEEVATWGPRAPELQTFIESSMKNLPQSSEEGFKEKQKEVFTFITKSYRNHKDFWNFVYQDIKKTIK